MILDFEQNKHYPLILRRPFLNTSRVVIDVYKGKITLKVEEEKVDFMMNRLIKDMTSEDSNEEEKIVSKEIKEASLIL